MCSFKGYLRQHPAFIRREFKSFSPLLSTEPDRLSSQAHSRLVADIERARAKLHVSSDRLAKLKQEVERYAQGAKSQDVGSDVQAAMLRILLHRYANRVPQKSLFEGEGADPPPRQEVKADAEVAEGARVYLSHAEGRALHYGIAAISDASTENAELLTGKNALGQILYFASAYNAITITPKYGQGNKEWCLIELGGPLILKHSLTLLRGGFLERQSSDLARYFEVSI